MTPHTRFQQLSWVIVAFFGIVVGETRASGETIKVLTYNIHMWQPKVDDLAAVIKASGADIVGLQEAWSESKNLELAKKLGFHVAFGGQNPTQRVPRKAHWINRHHMPQVLLTRHRIVSVRHFNAMEAKKDKTNPDLHDDVPIFRGGTLALLETAKGNRIVVFVLHLHPWGGPDNERMTNMRLAEIKGIQSVLKKHADLPVILLGDFNTESHHDRKTDYKVTRYLEKQGYTDLYRAVHPNVKTHPGVTCGKDGRIDFIFHNRHAKSVDAKVITDQQFGSRGYKQSDHLGVFGVVTVGK